MEDELIEENSKESSVFNGSKQETNKIRNLLNQQISQNEMLEKRYDETSDKQKKQLRVQESKDKMISALRKEMRSLTEDENNNKTDILLKYIKCQFLGSVVRVLKNKKVSLGFLALKEAKYSKDKSMNIACNIVKKIITKNIEQTDYRKKLRYFVNTLREFYKQKENSFKTEQHASFKSCVTMSIQVVERIMNNNKIFELNNSFVKLKILSEISNYKNTEKTIIDEKIQCIEKDYKKNLKTKVKKSTSLYHFRKVIESKMQKNSLHFFYKIKLNNLLRLSEKKWEGRYREIDAINKAKMEFFDTKNKDMMKNYDTSKSEIERMKHENFKNTAKIEELRTDIEKKDQELIQKANDLKSRNIDMKKLTTELESLKKENDSFKNMSDSNTKKSIDNEKKMTQYIKKLTDEKNVQNSEKTELVEKLQEFSESTGILKTEYEKIALQNNDQRNDIKKQDSIIKQKDDKITSYSKDYENLKKEYSKLKNLFESTKSDLDKKANEFTNLEQKFKNYTKIHDKSKSDTEGLTTEIIRMNEEKVKWMKSIEELNKELNNMKASQARLYPKIKKLNDLEKDIINKNSDIKQFKRDNEALRIKLAGAVVIDEEKLKIDKEIKEELASYKKMVENLNREKVNLMKDMTLLHDKWQHEQKDSNKYKNIAKESQNEIERIQSQMDVLVVALEQQKSMNKSLMVNKPNKQNDLNITASHTRTNSQNTTAKNISSILNTTAGKSSKNTTNILSNNSALNVLSNTHILSNNSGPAENPKNIIDQSLISDKMNFTTTEDTDEDMEQKIKKIRAKYDI